MRKAGPLSAAERFGPLHGLFTRRKQDGRVNGDGSDRWPVTRVESWIIDRRRAIRLEFPEAHEGRAWVGVRWMIRGKNFARMLAIDVGWPSARPPCRPSVPAPGWPCRSSRAPRSSKPVWWSGITGLVIDARTDWDEIADLVTGSHCLLAPKKLAAQVDRPGG